MKTSTTLMLLLVALCGCTVHASLRGTAGQRHKALAYRTLQKALAEGNSQHRRLLFPGLNIAIAAIVGGIVEAAPEAIEAGLSIAGTTVDSIRERGLPGKWAPPTLFANETQADAGCQWWVDAFAKQGVSKQDACAYVQLHTLARPGICPRVCPMSLNPQFCASLDTMNGGYYDQIELDPAVFWRATAETACGSALQGGETCRARCCTIMSLKANAGWMDGGSWPAKVFAQTPLGPIYELFDNAPMPRPAAMATIGCLLDPQYPTANTANIPGWSVNMTTPSPDGISWYIEGSKTSTWVK